MSGGVLQGVHIEVEIEPAVGRCGCCGGGRGRGRGRSCVGVVEGEGGRVLDGQAESMCVVVVYLLLLGNGGERFEGEGVVVVCPEGAHASSSF